MLALLLRSSQNMGYDRAWGNLLSMFGSSGVRVHPSDFLGGD